MASKIEEFLNKILSSRYGKDVRQAIHDGIHQCYEDGKAGSMDLIAREQIANLVSQNNPTEGNSELQDIRVGNDGTRYASAGEAVRKQVGSLSEDIGDLTYNPKYIKGCYYEQNGTLVFGVQFLDTYGEVVFDCSKYIGKIFSVTTYHPKSISVFIVDESMNILDTYSSTSNNSNHKCTHTIEIPKNSDKLLIPCYKPETDNYKVTISGFDVMTEVNNIKKEMETKIDKNSISQTIGDSENKIPSEKAVKEALDKLVVPDSINLIIGYTENVYCVGDSLTKGYVSGLNEVGKYPYSTYYNYPYFLGKLLNTNVTNLGFIGYTAKDIWDNKKDEIESISNSLVLIWIGTNGGLTNTIENDIPSDEISEYADTNTGNYGKIIKTLISNGNKVVLVQIFNCNSPIGVAATNNVISLLADKFFCKVVTIDNEEKDMLMNTSKYHINEDGVDGGAHFNSLGYSFVANYIFRKVNAIAEEDPQWFCIRKEQIG